MKQLISLQEQKDSTLGLKPTIAPTKKLLKKHLEQRVMFNESCS